MQFLLHCPWFISNSEKDLNILLLTLGFFFIQFAFIDPLVQQHIPKQKGSVCYAKHTVHDWHLRPIDLPITTISLPPQALLQSYWFKHCRSVSIFWFWAGQLRKWVIVITLLQDQLHLMQDKVLLLEQRKMIMIGNTLLLNMLLTKMQNNWQCLS